MTILTEQHNKWSTFSKLRQCGQVTISENLDKFGLVCVFCENKTICTRWDEFSRHIKQKHATDVHGLYKDAADLLNATTTAGTCKTPIAAEVQQRVIKMENTDWQMQEEVIAESQLDIGAEPQQEIAQKTSAAVEFKENTFDINRIAEDDFKHIDDADVESKNTTDPLEMVLVKMEQQLEDNLEGNKFNNAAESAISAPANEQMANDSKSTRTRASGSPKSRTAATTSSSIKDEHSCDSSSDADASDFEMNDNNHTSDDDEDDDEEDSNQPKMNIKSSNNQQVLAHIIDYFAKQPILWDSNHQYFYKRQQKIDLLTSLSVEVAMSFDISYTPKQLRKIFARFRLLYRNELYDKTKKQLRSHEEAARSSSLWCFDKLKFIHDSLNVPKAQKNLHAVNNQQLLDIADLLKTYPVLWNLDLDECRQHEPRRLAMANFVQDVNEKLSLKLNKNSLDNYLRRLKKAYSEEKQKRLTCEKNAKNFQPSQPQLYDKMNFIDAYIKPFSCDKCQKLMKCHNLYLAHMADHEGRKPFECPQCGKDFATASSLKVHIRRHNGDNPYKCPYCDKAFPSSTDLYTHERLHTGLKPYVCHICGKAFRSNSLLTQHVDCHDPSNFRFQCPHCPKKYRERIKLREHINSHMQWREHVCKECGKGFFALKTLKQHEQLHSDVMKYACDLCGKRFKQVSAMHSHKKTHQNLYNMPPVINHSSPFSNT